MELVPRILLTLTLAGFMPNEPNSPPRKPVAEFPLDFEMNLPLVRLLVSGSPQLFILDSAAVSCVMDEAQRTWAMDS